MWGRGAGGAGHFRAVIVSARFEGRSAVERQRLVYAALADEMGREIHALRCAPVEQWQAGAAGLRAAGEFASSHLSSASR
jgi:BolA protein